MPKKATIKKQTVVVIDIEDASLVDYQVALHPKMLTDKGLIVPSTLEGVSFRFDKRYVASKLEHDALKPLRVNKRQALTLVNDIFQAA